MEATSHTAHLDSEEEESGCASYDEIHIRVSRTFSFTLASSVLSLLGSALIVLTFVLWKDMRRSTARLILLFLAVADFLTAAGYFAASVTHSYFFPDNRPLDSSLYSAFDPFCTVQSYLVATFSTSSFFWTTYLALYFLLVLVFGVYRCRKKLIMVFNVTAWAIPLGICTAAAALRYLGAGNMALNAAPGMCFVALNTSDRSLAAFDREVTTFFVVEALAMKLWEVLAMIVISACYVTIFVFNRCFANQVCQSLCPKPETSNMVITAAAQRPAAQRPASSNDPNAYAKSVVTKSIKKADLKLLAIPIVFVLFRFWGTLRYFVSMQPNCHQYSDRYNDSNICIETDCFNVLYHPFLLCMQALFDPLQGFGNAVLFVFLSKAIMSRLLSSLKSCCQFFTCAMTSRIKGRKNKQAPHLNGNVNQGEPLLQKHYALPCERPTLMDSSSGEED